MTRTPHVLAVALLILLAACSLGSEPEGFQVTLTTGEQRNAIDPSNWTDCRASGCRFRAMGLNEGPGCAKNIQGRVQFDDTAGVVVVDGPSMQPIATYSWTTDPDPAAKVPAGETFTYATGAFVTPRVMGLAATYTSVAQLADLRGC